MDISRMKAICSCLLDVYQEQSIYKDDLIFCLGSIGDSSGRLYVYRKIKKDTVRTIAVITVFIMDSVSISYYNLGGVIEYVITTNRKDTVADFDNNLAKLTMCQDEE